MRSRPHAVIYIFEIHVDPDYSAEQYAEAWIAASRIIQQSKGACGTRLHRNLDDPSKLIAIASWDSKEARDASTKLMDDDVLDIIKGQAPFVDIRIIGEFAEAEWSVDPE